MIHETLGEVSQGFAIGFARIQETLGERDLQRFMGLSERIGKDLQDFGKGFAMIHKTLGEDSQGFARLLESIHKD